MPAKLPQTVKNNLEKSRAAAIAAVESYNRPGSRFRTGLFLVMIVVAWTELFHAIFYKRRKRPWYPMNASAVGRGMRYRKIDGEPKHWDLNECLKQYYKDENPSERKNLEFLIGLRNKIEHRHLPQLDASLYGECQAALLNLENLIIQEFGSQYALQEQLAISLQFSETIPTEKRRAVRALARRSAASVVEYIEKFRGRLPSTVLNSMKYSFSVFLVPRVANRKNVADVAVEFVKVNETSPEELERMTKLNILIREKHVPIANLDLFKPSQVLVEVKSRIPYRFTMSNHTEAWRHYKVRPPHNDPNPQQTKGEFCVFDSVHRDYLYTKAWIELLVKDLSDENHFHTVTGRTPTSV